MTPSRAVLHITSAPGGGVDRYLRDIAASTPFAHLALHVGDRLDVVEDLARGTYWPVEAASPAVADVLAATVAIVHLHSVDARSRARMRALRARTQAPLVATLHDVSFVYRDAFAAAHVQADADWVREVAADIAGADAVIAPSRYIRDLACATIAGIAPTVLQPGVAHAKAAERTLPAAFASQRPRNVVAVVGAIGPHKGSALLPGIAQGLAAIDSALVVIGYTDKQLGPGWAAPGLFVHGPYLDEALPGLLAAYAPRVALFPNRLPESFSYTLSEVWAAGLPVIVPDEGALGERVRDAGGGWLLPPRFDAAAAIALLAHVLSPNGAEEWARVKSHIVPNSESVPGLDAMARNVAAVYERFGLAPSPRQPLPDLSALRPLLAANLDGLAFREELVHLCEALANTAAAGRAAAEQARDIGLWADKLQADVHEAQGWAAKLEQDVAALNAQLAASVRQAQDLGGALAAARAELESARAALSRLPRIVQRLLLRRVARERR